ncbi:MAG: glycosyltransferase [Armatimonadetes bacterium]|nr:glycosyltransferase [Armatimonadota bacterium]
MRLVEVKLEEPRIENHSTTRFDLTIVVPTLNEAKNIPILYASLERVLTGLKWELVIVDDNSKDDSPALMVDMANRHDNFRFIRRFGRSGLSTACAEGMMTAASPIIAVMDADGQHDETKLMEMFRILDSDQADVVVGSRFAEGADLTSFTNFRTKLSLWSNVMAQKWFQVPLKDSMGNFFMLKRPVIEAAAPNLCGRGQKLLFDILLVSPDSLRVAEVPIVFGEREHGESKLSHIAAIDFGLQILDRKIGKFLPTKILVDMTMIVAATVLTTILIWTVMKLAFMATGTFPYAPTLVPFASIPAVVIAFYAQQMVIPKRKRSKGANQVKDFLYFLAINLPFIVLAMWVTAGVVQVGDPRLRNLFGASLVANIGIIVATSWRREVISKR